MFSDSIVAAGATALALALRVILAPTTLMAQQDSAMMSHDSAMTMQGDSDRMMSHDSSARGHDKMTGHGQMEGANMMFVGGSGQKAAGDYEVSETSGKPQLKLTDDFAVASAPDLYLVLANGAAPGTDALYLGKLKKTTGAQTFNLPKGKDLTGYTTLLVWSKKEKRAVASAEWHPPSGKMMEHM